MDSEAEGDEVFLDRFSLDDLLANSAKKEGNLSLGTSMW